MRIPAALEGYFDRNEAGFLSGERVFRGKRSKESSFRLGFSFPKEGFREGLHPDSVEKSPFKSNSSVLMPYFGCQKSRNSYKTLLVLAIWTLHFPVKLEKKSILSHFINAHNSLHIPYRNSF